MSIDGTMLLFEGFLQKRKDTLKIRWVTYWFRLQNTTLFFYTKKNGSALHLRGNYYIYAVQSVREVRRNDSKRFMFEIIMTNGKRKLLAAESAALRQEWVGHLWQAMHLSTCGVLDSSNTHPDVLEQRDRINSSIPIPTQTDSVMESLPARPLSAPTGHVHHEIKSIVSQIDPSEELNAERTTYQTPLPASNYDYHNGDSLNSYPWSSDLTSAGEQEGDYDILPIRKNMCEISTSTETEEDVYDVPLSYRRTAEYPESAESIYDVPSSLLRTMSDQTAEPSSEKQLEDEPYWRI